jgi:uncharacterized protein YggE
MSSMPNDAVDQGSGRPAPAVTVRGEAVLRTEPDEAMLSVSLSALKDAPGPALADVSHRNDGLIALLDELGIAPADRSTSGVSVYEEFDHTRDGRRSLGHRAVCDVAVRLTNLGLIGELVTRATTELDARIDGPRWQVAADNPIRLEAARAAAADGKRKAQAYAEGVGARIGELIKLSEPDLGFTALRRGGPRPMAAAAEPPMRLESGEQQVAAAIDVTFVLEPADSSS